MAQFNLDKYIKLIEEQGGRLDISFSTETEEWFCALEYGQESPDSPMVGGATYGAATNLDTALAILKRELGI